MARLLIIDDEPNMRWVLQEALAKAGYEVLAAGSGEDAVSLLAGTAVDLAILDLKMKGMDGLATLRQIHQRWPQLIVLMLTAYGTVATAVEAMQSGASDYLRKPFDVEELLFKVTRALERRALQQELARLRAAALPPMLGSAPSWRRAIEASAQAVALGLDLRLVGEPGSGRASIARLAQASGPRRAAPLVELDLAQLAASAQAALLAGAAGHSGFWAEAGQGSLLLRHIGGLGAQGRAMLDRLLAARAQAGGGPQLMLTGTAEEWAALAPLEQRAAEVHVPPLRAHSDDIALFVQHWLGAQPIDAAALALLHAYAWPGNLSELRGVVERAAQLAAGALITELHLPERLRAAAQPSTPYRLPPEGLSLEALEIALIEQALERAAGNKTRAAELLGLSRHTLLYRLEKYKIGELG
jgi:DNA-binding NtrC family response regulator